MTKTKADQSPAARLADLERSRLARLQALQALCPSADADALVVESRAQVASARALAEARS